jgi:hypothetical protein|tara:strand:- start:39 stop:140 length:102 start_codon:yes stop_codon:yes gene_type:complete
MALGSLQLRKSFEVTLLMLLKPLQGVGPSHVLK